MTVLSEPGIVPRMPLHAAPIPVLYEDPWLVAVDKPAWSVVHRTRGAQGALVLCEALPAQLGYPVFPVHRLDRQTSGVLVFARSSEAARLLSETIQAGVWQKRYLGLCRGLVEDSLRIDHEVPEDEVRRPALTEIEPVECFCTRYSLIQAIPRTGRRHQIRYHLKHASHPLVGDGNYGQGRINRFFRDTFGLGRLFLHAESLGLPHPVEPRLIALSVPLPEELDRVLRQLRLYEGEVA